MQSRSCFLAVLASCHDQVNRLNIGFPKKVVVQGTSSSTVRKVFRKVAFIHDLMPTMPIVRFDHLQLDVVAVSNLSTIHVFEAVQKP